VKKLLILAIVAVLVTTGGAFASAQQTTTATITVTSIGEDFATVTENLTVSVPTVFGDYSGTWSTGSLFSIYPSSSFTGDLTIRVYITNAAALEREYEHINMKLEFWDSDNVTADEQGIVQVLTLQNSEVLFTWENGTGNGPYKVVLSGGSFRLFPYKSYSDGSYQPQLWMEIIQR